MVSLERARFIFLALLVGLVVVIWVLPRFAQEGCNCLTVSFLDVGQGDAVYIRTPDEKEMLIDGGADSRVLRELAQHRSFFDRDLDVIVATHPDLDHIGGLVDVLKRFKIDSVLMTENQNDTPAAADFLSAVEEEDTAVIFAEAGQEFTLGTTTTVTIYSPRGDETNWEPNNASIIMKITYGETDILLTGDAPASIENYLVEKHGADLQADILKLGHHGSKTSTSELFLDTVRPRYVVVSAGIDNRYNHPHYEVMDRVLKRNIRILHTGTDESVTFESDGTLITVIE